MSAPDEKTQGNDHVEVEDFSPDAAMKDTEALHSLRGTDALMVAIRIEPVKKLGKGMIQLYAICALMMLGASMGGYDASLMGNLLAMPHFRSTFGASILGVKAGLISAMFSIGSVCALPFIGPCADTWGRRVGIGMGCQSSSWELLCRAPPIVFLNTSPGVSSLVLEELLLGRGRRTLSRLPIQCIAG